MTPSQRKQKLVEWIANHMESVSEQFTPEDNAKFIGALAEDLASLLTERELMAWQRRLSNANEPLSVATVINRDGAS